jgi:hypothetical protein
MRLSGVVTGAETITDTGTMEDFWTSLSNHHTDALDPVLPDAACARGVDFHPGDGSGATPNKPLPLQRSMTIGYERARVPSPIHPGSRSGRADARATFRLTTSQPPVLHPHR